MNTNVLIGVIVLVVGVVLLYFGYNHSRPVGEQIREMFSGRFSSATTWCFRLGSMASISGLLIIVLAALA
jgi:hypothetical protein